MLKNKNACIITYNKTYKLKYFLLCFCILGLKIHNITGFKLYILFFAKNTLNLALIYLYTFLFNIFYNMMNKKMVNNYLRPSVIHGDI